MKSLLAILILLCCSSLSVFAAHIPVKCQNYPETFLKPEDYQIYLQAINDYETTKEQAGQEIRSISQCIYVDSQHPAQNTLIDQDTILLYRGVLPGRKPKINVKEDKILLLFAQLPDHHSLHKRQLPTTFDSTINSTATTEIEQGLSGSEIGYITLSSISFFLFAGMICSGLLCACCQTLEKHSSDYRSYSAPRRVDSYGGGQDMTDSSATLSTYQMLVSHAPCLKCNLVQIYIHAPSLVLYSGRKIYSMLITIPLLIWLTFSRPVNRRF